MIRRKIDPIAGEAALRAGNPSNEQTALAVRFCLEELATRFPGGMVELRVPPYGATQVLAGSVHRRGTPPNVVEMEPQTFLDLCLGKSGFEELKNQGKIFASGVAVLDLARLFPLFN